MSMHKLLMMYHINSIMLVFKYGLKFAFPNTEVLKIPVDE